MTQTTTHGAAVPTGPPPAVPARGRVARHSATGCALLSAGVVLAMLFVRMPRELSGTLVLTLVITLLLAGVPIAFSMIGASLLGLWKIGGPAVIAATFTERTYMTAASWQLSVIPLFVLMGIAMWRSGLTTKAYQAANQWLGRLPGGLAVGTNFAGAGLAAASGSSVGISFALGRIAIPEMMRAGYAPSLATGVVAMAGTLGQLIPPSVMLVIYAGVAQVPVGPQLLAAVIPGIMIAIAFGLMVVVMVLIKPSLAPRADMTGVTWSTRLRSLRGVVPIALVVLVVIGGLFGGVFTPTEAGAVGALTAIIAGWLISGPNRGLRALSRYVGRSAVDAVVATAAIFLMLIGVELLNRVMTLSRVTVLLTETILAFDLNRVTFLFVLMVLYLILGLALEPIALILLTVPVLIGPLTALGVDMMWFGIFLVVLVEVAVVSPPIGILCFIVHRLAQDKEVNLGVTITLNDVYRGVIWFVVAALLILSLLIFVPEIVTWLPQQAVQ